MMFWKLSLDYIHPQSNLIFRQTLIWLNLHVLLLCCRKKAIRQCCCSLCVHNIYMMMNYSCIRWASRLIHTNDKFHFLVAMLHYWRTLCSGRSRISRRGLKAKLNKKGFRNFKRTFLQFTSNQQPIWTPFPGSTAHPLANWMCRCFSNATP